MFPKCLVLEQAPQALVFVCFVTGHWRQFSVVLSQVMGDGALLESLLSLPISAVWVGPHVTVSVKPCLLRDGGFLRTSHHTVYSSSWLPPSLALDKLENQLSFFIYTWSENIMNSEQIFLQSYIFIFNTPQILNTIWSLDYKHEISSLPLVGFRFHLW